MEENPSEVNGNLYQDCLESDQPQGTIRFALNTVNENSEGNNKKSIEEGNELAHLLPTNYIPLGKIYIGDKKFILFSISKNEALSEIGLVDDYNNYTTLVNANLGFKLSHQISGVFRLRRGCERTIYFVIPKPMIFNLDKPQDFKDGLGAWDIDKFSLFKTYSKIPTFSKVEVLESGNILPGSYNAAIQYLDEDLNPTEFITTCEPVHIYNDSTLKSYETIRGSTSKQTDYQDFGATNKSIRFTFENFDSDYPYYRVAIIHSNEGNGRVTKVTYSEEIPTEIKVYTFTGNISTATEGTVEDIALFNNIINSAEHIQQIENRLTLHNLTGNQTNLCGLQKYASRIKADLVTKEVILNTISEGNPKNPTVLIDGAGYMPGEIYPFGIVYVFEGFISPVYHIPGKALLYPSEMDSDNNCDNTYYTESDSCGTGNYWGLDSEGNTLVGSQVRHHRFPLRSKVGKPLYTEQTTSSSGILTRTLTLKGIIVTIPTVDKELSLVVEYKDSGVLSSFNITLAIGATSAIHINIPIASSSSPITDVKIYEDSVLTSSGIQTDNGVSYTSEITETAKTSTTKVYKSEVFGIKFSGIEVPAPEDLNGEKLLGYYIVRCERTDENKSIVDSAVLTPLIEHELYVAHGHIFPKVNVSAVKDDIISFISPENKFLSKEAKNITSIVQEGYFKLENTQIYESRIQDVMPGTSYDADKSKKRETDSDGFDLHTVSRNNNVKYNRFKRDIATGSEIKEVFYLDTLSSKVVTDRLNNRKEVFNISGDNKIGIIQLDKAYDKSDITTKLPYVILKRNVSDPYANFRVLPYFKETKNMQLFSTSSNSVEVFNGDSFITSLRYTSAVYYDTRLRQRASKSGLFNAIIGALSVIAGTVLVATGLGTAAGIMLIGYGLTQVSSGLKKEQISKVYNELYEAGLRNTVKDDTTNQYFTPNPPDDSIQWLSDTVTNLWFESSVNMSIRSGVTVNLPDFLNAPILDIASTENEFKNYIIQKLTTLDTNNSSGRIYQGFANAELYEINLDYLRRNKEKYFYHLGLEYDCCSECTELFPHRNAYSEQSFQEELTDNYRIFLPNNYMDMEGETGVITDAFRIQNNLYIHTEEALWHLPANIQERVTGDIVSFIGTGDFFSIPPRKIVDDQQLSAGTRHKWATVKTAYGVYFVSEAEGRIYCFDGNKLIPISDQGLSHWFNEHGKLTALNEFKRINGRNYELDNNPSNPLGIGFISTYDTKKKRIIFTKKDFGLSSALLGSSDYRIVSYNGQNYIFNEYQQTIDFYTSEGYEFLGVENNRLKFKKVVDHTRVEARQNIILTYSNDEITQVFTKECAEHYIGSEVPYTVPEGTYFGDTQEEANALAQADIDENGQDYANSEGNCTLPVFPTKWIPAGQYCETEPGADVIINYAMSYGDNPITPSFLVVFKNGVETHRLYPESTGVITGYKEGDTVRFLQAGFYGGVLWAESSTANMTILVNSLEQFNQNSTVQIEQLKNDTFEIPFGTTEIDVTLTGVSTAVGYTSRVLDYISTIDGSIGMELIDNTWETWVLNIDSQPNHSSSHAFNAKTSSTGYTLNLTNNGSTLVYIKVTGQGGFEHIVSLASGASISVNDIPLGGVSVLIQDEVLEETLERRLYAVVLNDSEDAGLLVKNIKYDFTSNAAGDWYYSDAILESDGISKWYSINMLTATTAAPANGDTVNMKVAGSGTSGATKPFDPYSHRMAYLISTVKLEEADLTELLDNMIVIASPYAEGGTSWVGDFVASYTGSVYIYMVYDFRVFL